MALNITVKVPANRGKVCMQCAHIQSDCLHREHRCGLYGGIKPFDNYAANSKNFCSGVDFEPAELETPAPKHDHGKPRAALVLGEFAQALSAVAQVGTFGAEKYTPSGWLQVPNAIERYNDAAMRHWLKMQSGETLDPESGQPHSAHYAWNVLAVLELQLRESNQNEK